MPRQQVVKFSFQQGYASDLSISIDRIGYTAGYMRQGSRNVLVTGAGLIRPFKGLTKNATPIGSRQNFLTDNGYAGLGDFDTPGFGTVFKCIGLLFFMGGGPLAVNGTPILDGVGDPVLASAQFQYLVKNAGVFDIGDDTHRYDVGHAQPSAPAVYAKTPPSLDQKPMNAVVAINIWRADSLTGQPSRPSESVTISLSASSAIVQFPAADTNGQDVWGIGGTLLGIQIGNIYEIPTSRNGEVLESTLSYTRTLVAEGNITIALTTLTLDAGTPVGDRFTTADIGRRVFIAGKLDSWITGLTDALTATVADAATATAVNQNLVITHAVDGYTRAIEVSWSDDDLLSTATLAPFYAFEPMSGRFAGFILDTFFIEDIEGTIFYSTPNFLSFPRLNNKIFTDDKATVYIDTGWGYQWRIAPQSISQLYYTPGSTSPIGLAIKAKNIGCKYPTNACLGYGGRLMMWAGSPMVMSVDGSLDATLHTIVATEFDDWADQTESQPVVTAYDPIDKYELWCYGQTIMAVHAPSSRWCSPIDIAQWVAPGGIIVGQVIVNEKLYLVVKEGSDLVHYAWNTGSGSDIIIRSYFKETPGDTTISTVQPVIKAGKADLQMVYNLIGDFHRVYAIGTDTVPGTTDGGSQFQVGTIFKPNLRGCNTIGVEMTCDNADGYASIDYVNLYGEWTETVSNPRAL